MMTAALFLATAACAQEVEHTKDPLKEIRERFEKKDAVLLDVREQGEWDAGHVKGAAFLPLSRLKGAGAEDVGKALPKEGIVYTYCRSGNRSRTAAAILKKLGYDARALRPGYAALVEAGFPSEKKE